MNRYLGGTANGKNDKSRISNSYSCSDGYKFNYGTVCGTLAEFTGIIETVLIKDFFYCL